MKIRNQPELKKKVSMLKHHWFIPSITDPTILDFNYKFPWTGRLFMNYEVLLWKVGSYIKNKYIKSKLWLLIGPQILMKYVKNYFSRIKRRRRLFQESSKFISEDWKYRFFFFPKTLLKKMSFPVKQLNPAVKN